MEVCEREDTRSQSFAPEVDADHIDPRIGRPACFEHTILRHVWLGLVQSPQCETTLLQPAFRIVPFLIHYEFHQSWEEADATKLFDG